MNKVNLSFAHTFFDRIFGSDAIIRPERDWKILLGLLVALTLGAFGYDLSMYHDVASGEMYVTVGKSDLTLESLKTDMLKKAVDAFEARKAAMVTFKVEPLVDPSK